MADAKYYQDIQRQQEIHDYITASQWALIHQNAPFVPPMPYINPKINLMDTYFGENITWLTPEQIRQNEFNALDPAEQREIVREKAMRSEKLYWMKTEQCATKLEKIRLYGYSPESFEDPRYGGLDAMGCQIARDDKYRVDVFTEKYYREQAEKKTKENIEMYGYSVYQQRQEDQQQPVEQMFRHKQMQQAIMERRYEEEQQSKNNRHLLSSSFLLIFGALWFIIQTLGYLLAYAMTTFWNRYQEYDIPATPCPHERRSDEDILNAQFQQEMAPRHFPPDNQITTHASSWTGSAFEFLVIFLNAVWRLVIALIYSLWQLTKAPLSTCRPFVRKNKASCLLFALFLAVIFNPIHRHPYLPKPTTPYLAGAPPPRPTRFPPPEVLQFPVSRTEILPSAVAPPGEVAPCQKAFANAFIDPGFPGISWPAMEFGSPEWDAQEIEIAETTMCDYWPE